MNPFSRSLAALFCIASTLLLGGCVEMEQDIWISKDGGGKAIIKLGISKQMLSMAAGFAGDDAEDPLDLATIEKQLANDPNVIASMARIEESDTFKYVIIDMDVKDITKIGEVQQGMAPDGPMAGGGGAPDFQFTKTDAGTYKVVADFSAPAGIDDGGAALGMMKGMIGDAKIVLRIHADPIEHNGVEEGDAIVWSVPLVDLLGGKAPSIEGEFKPGGVPGGAGVTFWLVLGSIVCLALVLFIVFQSQKPKLV